MSVRTIKEIVAEEVTRTVITCDICQKEIPQSEIDVWRASQNRRIWWKQSLDTIVGILKGSIYDEPLCSAEFNVHVNCAYNVIRKAINEAL